MEDALADNPMTSKVAEVQDYLLNRPWWELVLRGIQPAQKRRRFAFVAPLEASVMARGHELRPHAVGVVEELAELEQIVAG